MIYEYRGELYPSYLKTGDACRHIAPSALHFCRGRGLDVGAGAWPLPGATPWEIKDGCDGMKLPEADNGGWDFIFSSHCLEHLSDPVAALEHWKERLRPGGVLFLYLPHPEMRYWNPQFCRKHRHLFYPGDVHNLVADLGFENVISSERDLYWSFAVVGFKPLGRSFETGIDE